MSTNPKTRQRLNSELSERTPSGDDRIVDKGQPVVPLRPGWLRMKRAADVVMASLMLVPAVPALLLAAILVKLTSRGPVLYWQTRVGMQGRLFNLYKLRTMIHNAEAISGPVWATANDPRVTAFGRFLRATHIDELPQLFSVLAGDMSLVGPRPERPEFVAKLEWEYDHYPDRLNVRPGITGLAQLKLPPDSTIENVRHKLRYDLHYVEHVGPWLDFRILAFTCVHAVRGVARLIWSSIVLPSIDDSSIPPQDDYGLRINTARGGSME